MPALAGAQSVAARAADSVETPEEDASEGPLIASAPMLQNYAETSVGIVFAVRALANGYALVGEREDLSDARRFKTGGYRLTEIDDRVACVRVTGLKPATRYYYRIGADRIHYGGGYDMKILGNEEDPRVYSFVTAGKGAEARFCVINDTHRRWDSFGRVIDKVAEIAPSCVIWNGDACRSEDTVEQQIRIFLNPEIGRKDYACRTPYLLCPGNHDQRGRANRHLERVWMFRQPEERAARDWDLGRNFAVRMGEVALIGLDTGEDKQDTNPLFAGLFNNTAYRQAQALWLQDALKRKDIASAPFLVAFCHIPLYDDNPSQNPGDVLPDDRDPRYSSNYARWQRTCGNLWMPLLEKAGCQLLVTGHQHRYRYFAPEKDRPWAQIIGGGPLLGMTGRKKLKPDPGSFPTVIEGEVRDGKLRITVHNIHTGAVQDRFTFTKK